MRDEVVFMARVAFYGAAAIAFAFLMFWILTMSVPRAHAADAAAAEALTVLQWEAPTQNIDGSPLTDLDGFKIYWGAASRAYTQEQDIPNETLRNYTLTLPLDPTNTPQTLFFAMTAYDGDGNESEFSNEVSRTFDLADVLPPGAPRIQAIEVSCRVVGNGVKCKIDGVITE